MNGTGLMVEDEFVSVGDPLPRIVSVVPLDERRAEIAWKGGKVDIVDLMPALASHRLFVRLRTDDALFATMKASEYGDCVEWSDGAELAAEWIEELVPGTLDNSEFRKAMDDLNFTLDGMAARLGIARRLVADYRKNKTIPPYIALATRYLVEHLKRAG